MLIFKHITDDVTVEPPFSGLSPLPIDYMPYRLEAMAAQLGEDYELGFYQGEQFYAIPNGATLPEHDRSVVHYEEGEPYVADGAAHRSLVLRANSVAEVQAFTATAPWEAFKAAMLNAPLFKGMILAAFPTEPVACIGITDAIAQARQTGSTALFEEAMAAIIAASEPDPADLAALVSSLSQFSLPQFMTAAFQRLLEGIATPA